MTVAPKPHPPIADGQRYLRQVLLAEVGKEGQAKLAGARWGPDAARDPLSQGVTETYLARAGVQVPDGDPELTLTVAPGPDAALAGAFEAVEFIKQTLGVGTPGTLPPSMFEFGTQ